MAKGKKKKEAAKLDAKKVFTYAVLLELLAVLLVYMLVFNKYTDLTSSLNSQNITLSNRVRELSKYYNEMDENKKQIELMGEGIDKMLEDIPADVREEDVLMLAVETLKKANLAFTSINVSDRSEFYSIDKSIVDTAQVGEYDEAFSFGERKVQYANITDYKNLKEIIKTIQNSDDKKVISNISYSRKEEEHSLEGTIEVLDYFVLGAKKEYIKKYIPGYEAGLLDLFKLYEEENKEDATTGL